MFKSQAEALADGTQYAICLVCTKSLPDILPTPVLLADALKSSQIGAYVLIQNGLSVEDDLAAATSVPIVSCVAWVSIMANPAGDVVTWGNVEKLGCGVFRADKGTPSKEEKAALDLWVGLVQAGEGNTVITEDIRATRFAKVSKSRGGSGCRLDGPRRPQPLMAERGVLARP